MKLNLGCGRLGQKEGFVNIDFIQHKGVDMILDLNKVPYPFEDNSIDEIYSCHNLEHLDIEFEDFLQEMRRIMKKNALLTIIVPIGGSALHPNHKMFFHPACFHKEDLSCLQHYNAWRGLEIISTRLRFIKCGKIWFLNRLVEPLMNMVRPDIYSYSFLRYLFPANEVMVKIKKDGK